MRPLATSLLLATLSVPAAGATVLTLEADRDATLIEDPAGQLANGAGPELFAGRTAQPRGSLRRALVRFDLAALPRGAIIETVRLVLFVSQAASRPSEVRVHRLLADWGEGASFSTGGGGVPPAPGDSTWVHRFYEPLPPAPPPGAASRRSLWETPGGDFEARPRASLPVPGTGVHVWQGPGLVEDVEDWARRPGRNFGWILLGDEGSPSTARRFGSRQDVLPDRRPRLEVVYRER